MATENQPSESATGEVKTTEQNNQAGEVNAGGETPQAGTESEATGGQAGTESEQAAPKDPGKESLLRDLRGERDKRQALTAEVQTLKNQLTTAEKAVEELDSLQTRYDRLEAFLTHADGDLGRALDSKTFTAALFESDKDIDEIVSDWHTANPSATSKALGGAGPTSEEKKPSMNDLLRSASR